MTPILTVTRSKGLRERDNLVGIFLWCTEGLKMDLGAEAVQE